MTRRSATAGSPPSAARMPRCSRACANCCAADASLSMLAGAAGLAGCRRRSFRLRQIGVYWLDELIGAGGMGSVYRAQPQRRPVRADGGDQVHPLDAGSHRAAGRCGAKAARAHGSPGHRAHSRWRPHGERPALPGHGIRERRGAGPARRTSRNSILAERVELLREVCAGGRARASAPRGPLRHQARQHSRYVRRAARSSSTSASRASRTWPIRGREGFTRAYTSPQRLGGAPATITDDVYSLGVVLRELLTGKAAAGRRARASSCSPELFAIIAQEHGRRSCRGALRERRRAR